MIDNSTTTKSSLVWERHYLDDEFKKKMSAPDTTYELLEKYIGLHKSIEEYNNKYKTNTMNKQVSMSVVNGNLVRTTTQVLSNKAVKMFFAKTKKIEGNGRANAVPTSYFQFDKILRGLQNSGELVRVSFVTTEGDTRILVGKVASVMSTGHVGFVDYEIELGLTTHRNGSKSAFTNARLKYINWLDTNDTRFYPIDGRVKK